MYICRFVFLVGLLIQNHIINVIIYFSMNLFAFVMHIHVLLLGMSKLLYHFNVSGVECGFDAFLNLWNVPVQKCIQCLITLV